MDIPVIFVVGPTGSGKSKLAVELALKLQETGFRAEIISTDVMQMYSGLPIATNKTTIEEQKGIPHHFLEFLDPFKVKSYTVHDFVNQAVPVIDRMRSAGTIPIVCGGTNYYVQGLALRDTLVHDDKPDTEEATAAEKTTDLRTGPQLLAELEKVDPEMARRWHPNDVRRIRRSLEIFETTGKQHSVILQEQGNYSMPRWENHFILWVDVPPDALKTKISTRVRQMLDNGIAKEVLLFHDQIVQAHCEDTPLATAIGFKEFAPYFIKQSDAVLQMCADDLIVRTANYAKQQSKWIRNRFATNENITLFKLNGGDVDAAFKIAHAFLHQKQCDVINLRHVLPSRIEEQKHSKTFHCDVCDVVLCGQAQHDLHMSSRGHHKLKQRQKRLREAASN